MKIQELKPKEGSKKKKKRVGRGIAAGGGKTAGRGTKGQKSRSGFKLRPGFEGGQTPLIMRLPKKRGFKSRKKIEYKIINLKDLNIFKEGEKVDKKKLKEAGLIKKTSLPVKLLGEGEVEKKIEIEVEAASKSAIKKLEKIGGKVTILKNVSKNI